MEEKHYAVLIDSDNISSKYISYILAEMTKYGVITYKRIYGDWTSNQTSKWKNELLENSITPIQQFSNTVGKNATDSALIIDAMDILYSKNVDGFCIVSSDSDFTRLANRLRESGMDVIGMGESKTPRSFRAACTIFTNLEVLMDQEDGPAIVNPIVGKGNKSNRQEEKHDHKSIISDIMTFIMENDDKGKITELSEIGSRLQKKYSDFDVRNYGYSSLSKLLEEFETFELSKRNNCIVTVRIKDDTLQQSELENFVIAKVKASGKNGIDLGGLGTVVHRQYEGFNVKEYGYSTFSKFIQNIKQVEIKELEGKKLVIIRTN